MCDMVLCLSLGSGSVQDQPRRNGSEGGRRHHVDVRGQLRRRRYTEVAGIGTLSHPISWPQQQSFGSFTKATHLAERASLQVPHVVVSALLTHPPPPLSWL